MITPRINLARVRGYALATLLVACSVGHSQELLTGDTRLACEAIMCLAAGSQPSECSPSIQRYFSIVRKKPGETLQARSDFLRMCPAANQSAEMASLVAAQVNGAGMCSASYLNQVLRIPTPPEFIQSTIFNQVPGNCAALAGHAYSGQKLPRYIGLPERGGHWAEEADFNSALQTYNARIKAEDAARAEAAKAAAANPGSSQ